MTTALPTPTRKQQLRDKRASVGLLPGEYAELVRIELAELRAADAAAERAGEGRLLPVGRQNFHE